MCSSLDAPAHNEFHSCSCTYPDLDSPDLGCVALALGAALLVFYFVKRKST